MSFLQLLYPIHRLSQAQRGQYIRHLLMLEAQDRYLRFGHAATDDQIRSYGAGIDFSRDQVLGIYDASARLIGAAHLAHARQAPQKPQDPVRAEFGVSVLSRARGQGLGSRLFSRAALDARNDGVEVLDIHALAENTAMVKIARNAGATIERIGNETQASVRLSPANAESFLTESLAENIGAADYAMKQQNRQFWRWVREGWRTLMPAV